MGVNSEVKVNDSYSQHIHSKGNDVKNLGVVSSKDAIQERYVNDELNHREEELGVDSDQLANKHASPLPLAQESEGQGEDKFRNGDGKYGDQSEDEAYCREVVFGVDNDGCPETQEGDLCQEHEDVDADDSLKACGHRPKGEEFDGARPIFHIQYNGVLGKEASKCHLQ